MSLSAIVLCGGLSSRMGDLTADTPKSLLKANKNPLFAHNWIFYTKKWSKKIYFSFRL